jgi:photosystem II stability/assembly factor-like uncharacterized protein
VDVQTGYAVGDYGTILGTTDGGVTWASQTSGTHLDLRSVHFPVDAQTGYAVGGRITTPRTFILKTTDGGIHWESQLEDTGAILRSVSFPTNALTGYAVGYFGKILKTTNGGTLWSGQTSGTLNWLASVHFPLGDQTGYAAGDYGTILKTTDGGTGVEETAELRGQRLEVRIMAKPNPFTHYATVPGHEAERFSLYDISGQKVGTYKGDRIGTNLPAGVYFLRTSGKTTTPVRIVKVR